jgi:hypothetical protein
VAWGLGWLHTLAFLDIVDLLAVISHDMLCTIRSGITHDSTGFRAYDRTHTATRNVAFFVAQWAADWTVMRA